MKDLSIVIPFLNEGEEVVKTIESIFLSADAKLIEIIVVDDASCISFEKEIKKFDVVYYRNPVRIGVSKSRDVGIFNCTSPRGCLIDAHMRFRKDNWMEKMCSEIDNDKDSLFCTTCLKLTPDQTDIAKSEVKAFGAGIELVSGGGKKVSEILEPKWITSRKKFSLYDVPCVLGANYFFNVQKYKDLLGLIGLEMWGSDEIYLSLKYWLSGGSCKIVPDIEIGHIFRDGKAPYVTDGKYIFYNKLLVAFTLFPYDFSLKLFENIQADKCSTSAFIMFRRKIREIIEYKNYYDSIFKRTISQVFSLTGIKQI